jgi:hypothetical protein
VCDYCIDKGHPCGPNVPPNQELRTQKQERLHLSLNERTATIPGHTHYAVPQIEQAPQSSQDTRPPRHNRKHTPYSHMKAICNSPTILSTASKTGDLNNTHRASEHSDESQEQVHIHVNIIPRLSRLPSFHLQIPSPSEEYLDYRVVRFWDNSVNFVRAGSHSYGVSNRFASTLTMIFRYSKLLASRVCEQYYRRMYC